MYFVLIKRDTGQPGAPCGWTLHLLWLAKSVVWEPEAVVTSYSLFCGSTRATMWGQLEISPCSWNEQLSPSRSPLGKPEARRDPVINEFQFPVLSPKCWQLGLVLCQTQGLAGLSSDYHRAKVTKITFSTNKTFSFSKSIMENVWFSPQNNDSYSELWILKAYKVYHTSLHED